MRCPHKHASDRIAPTALMRDFIQRYHAYQNVHPFRNLKLHSLYFTTVLLGFIESNNNNNNNSDYYYYYLIAILIMWLRKR